MRFKLTFEDLTTAEALHLMAQAGGQAPAGSVGAAPAPRPAAAPPMAAAPPPAGAPMAAPPPAGAPMAAPPPAMAAPPPAVAAAPPPPVAAAPTGAITHAMVLTAMQAFAKVHKSAGVKPILAQLNVQKVQDVTDQAQLKWLLDTFTAGAKG